LFEAYFKTDLYYDNSNLTIFKQITEIADKLYDLSFENSYLAGMDWIAILALKKYFRKSN